MTQRPRTFTFYSYKGGVGRSMALLNVAYTLHSMGRHVLIVDLDLEAPGVSGFLRRNDELAPHDADKPDVVDLLKDVLPLARWQLGDASRPEVPVLASYLREVKPEKFAQAQNDRFRRTRLDVLCASDERDYTNRLAALDIASLSAEDLAETGNVLREIFFRHQFPWAWQQGEDDQPTRYDYILIDSRTGFTETSGLCIGPLADRLVIFCGLNDQNINGTAEFLRVVGLKAGPRATPWDDADDIEDPTRTPSLGDKPSLLVASPVPAGEMELKKARFQEMERVLKLSPAHHISYHPRLSLYETVFLRDFPQEIIAREYRELTDSILSLVGDHPRQHQEKIGPLRTRQRDGQAGDRISLLQYAAMLDERAAAQLAAPLRYVADQLANQAAILIEPEADALFASAYESYRAVLAIKPDDHWALNNWGAALAAQAQQKTGTEADGLFSAACEKYQSAITLKPDKFETLNNWGVALSAQAKQKTKEEADDLYVAAGEKYRAAIACKPDYYIALTNWGLALASQARQKIGREADALYAAAVGKYQSAIAIKPDYHTAFNNWGNTLVSQSRQKTELETEALFAAAFEKYQQAITINPEYHVALNNWGNAISAQAQRKTGRDAAALFASAQEKYLAALLIKPGDQDVIYNLGCLAALQKDARQALEWLEKAILAGKQITQRKLTDETDFDPIRETPEFKEFLANLPA